MSAAHALGAYEIQTAVAAKMADIRKSFWAPMFHTADALDIAFALHLQITCCERAVRVGERVEYYAHHDGDKERALRYAICIAALGVP